MHTRDGRFISQIGIKTLGMIVNILMSDLKKGVLISWFVLNYHKVSRSETLSLSPGLKARLSHHIPTKKAKSDVRTNFDFQTIKKMPWRWVTAHLWCFHSCPRFVSRILQKLLNRFLPNLDGGWSRMDPVNDWCRSEQSDGSSFFFSFFLLCLL